MAKKYELWFSNEDKQFKIASFMIDDERFTDYILDTVMSNLEYDISELQEELGLDIEDIRITEIDTE